ncbi:MAG: hypothetical protein AAFZ91_08635 [Pseudomonadota bacterium]
MKVSELRGLINTLETKSHDFSVLDEALKKFDDMELSLFSNLLKKVPAPKVHAKPKRVPKTAVTDNSSTDVANKLMRLKSDPEKFEAEIDRLGSRRSFTKQDMQKLFSEIFSTKSRLPSKLTKPEMVARFKRQRRRDSNFASA